MFSFSPGQGSVEHIFVISHGIMVGNYVKRKKEEVMLDEKMGKVAKGKKKKKERKKKGKEKKKKKMFLYVLKILC